MIPVSQPLRMNVQRISFRSFYHLGRNVWHRALNSSVKDANQIFKPALGMGSPQRLLLTAAHRDDLHWRKLSTYFETLAIREGFDPSQFQSKCVVPLIVTSSIFYDGRDWSHSTQPQGERKRKFSSFTGSMHETCLRSNLCLNG